MDELYAKIAVSRAADAAVAAIADLHPARLSVGRSTARRISFGRNYLMKDGKVRTNPGVGNPDIVRPVDTADETVQVLRIDRDGEKPICVINFQTHPDVVGGEAISADWPGLTRTVFEAATRGEAHCIVLNGTQGDVNHVNVMPRPGEANGLRRDFDDVDRGYGHARHMANVLAAAALSVWMKCESVPAGAVRVGMRNVKVPAHKARPGDEKGLVWARGSLGAARGREGRGIAVEGHGADNRDRTGATDFANGRPCRFSRLVAFGRHNRRVDRVRRIPGGAIQRNRRGRSRSFAVQDDDVDVYGQQLPRLLSDGKEL